MENKLSQITAGIIIAILTYFGTSGAASKDSDKVMDTYANIIQQQAKMMENCK